MVQFSWGNGTRLALALSGMDGADLMGYRPHDQLTALV
jgi:hypothetical protein